MPDIREFRRLVGATLAARCLSQPDSMHSRPPTRQSQARDPLGRILLASDSDSRNDNNARASCLPSERINGQKSEPLESVATLPIARWAQSEPRRAAGIFVYFPQVRWSAAASHSARGRAVRWRPPDKRTSGQADKRTNGQTDKRTGGREMHHHTRAVGCSLLCSARVCRSHSSAN